MQEWLKFQSCQVTWVILTHLCIHFFTLSAYFVHFYLCWSVLGARIAQYSVSWTIWGLIPGRDKIFLFSRTFKPALGSTYPSVQWILGIISTGESGWSMKQTAYLHLVWWLRMSRGIPLLLHYAFMVCTGTPLPLVHVAHCVKSVLVCVMKTGYRKFMYVDILKAVFRAQFQYFTTFFWCGLLFSEFYFSPSRIAASHSMEDHFLIMKVCHTVKHITMQREDHFVLGAISQSQVCTCKFITCVYQFLKWIAITC